MATSRLSLKQFPDVEPASGVVQPGVISFRNLKIDYSKCLGRGRFGAVYNVVNRPDNESCLSYYAPYIYDWIFPANNSMQLSTDYCVKINYSSIAIFNNVFNDTAFFYGMMVAAPYAFNEAMRSFQEPLEQKQANHLLRKYSVSQITIFNSDNIYAQFKTLIRGETFSFYLHKNYFINPHEFELRKAFVDFLRKINTPKLAYSDMHGGNIMYDEIKKIWDLPDVEVVEYSEKTKFDSQKDNISFVLKGLLSGSAGFYDDSSKLSHAKRIIKELAKTARTKAEYTAELDKKILVANKSRSDMPKPANSTVKEGFNNKNNSPNSADNESSDFLVEGVTRFINWIWEKAPNKRQIADESHPSWERLNIR